MTETYDFYTNYNLTLKYKKKGLSGLSNLGNTCFMNSIIQCLSNNLKLTEYFLTESYKNEDSERLHQKRNEYQLVLTYTNLLKNMWETNTVLKPRSFKTAIGKLVNKYSDYSQQDSHEFLIHLLEFLHKGICYEIEVGVKGEIIKNSDKMMIECINTWRNYFEKEYSIIIDLYYGMFINKIYCKCNGGSSSLSSIETASSIGYEPYSCLSLSINDTDTNLSDCLDSYFSMSEINYHCEKCKTKSINRKETKFWTLPNFLIINLKRFTNKNKKITRLIDFPLDNLDLTKYVSSDREDPNNYIYSLYAVNYHAGTTGSGHYYSVIKNLDDNYYLMNDANVSKYAQGTRDAIVNENAYILFYYRKFIK
jgi:ubiquitin carboxyl-terminal hydrolase 8